MPPPTSRARSCRSTADGGHRVAFWGARSFCRRKRLESAISAPCTWALPHRTPLLLAGASAQNCLPVVYHESRPLAVSQRWLIANPTLSMTAPIKEIKERKRRPRDACHHTWRRRDVVSYVGTVAYTFTTHTTPHSNARHRAYSQYSDDRYIHTHTEKVKKWPTRHARTPLELLARAVRVAAAPSLTPGTSSHSSSRSWSTSRARCTCRQPKPACTRTRASPRRGTHCRSRTNSTGTR